MGKIEDLIDNQEDLKNIIRDVKRDLKESKEDIKQLKKELVSMGYDLDVDNLSEIKEELEKDISRALKDLERDKLYQKYKEEL